MNILFKEFTNEAQRRDIGWKLYGEDEGEDLGIGTTNENFDSSGTKPEEMNRLKM